MVTQDLFPHNHVLNTGYKKSHLGPVRKIGTF